MAHQLKKKKKQKNTNGVFRTQAPFPALTQWLTTFCSFSSRRSAALCWPLWAPYEPVQTDITNAHTQRKIDKNETIKTTQEPGK